VAMATSIAIEYGIGPFGISKASGVFSDSLLLNYDIDGGGSDVPSIEPML